MGASVSTNVSKIAVNAISKICSEIVQSSKIGDHHTQIISVKNSGKDVIIKGNKLSQTANLNMSALLNAMSSEIAQQNLATELSQQTKALTSGLNLGQFSSASNTMDGLIQATIELFSKIGQTCATESNQFQEINVEHSVGSVTIENNVLDQVTEIIQNCAGNAVTNSSAIQDLTTKLSQTATATAEGLSPYVLAVIAAIILGIPVMGGIVGGVVFLKYIFPIILIIGIVMIVLYFTWTKKNVSMTAYSKFINNTPVCNGIQLTKSIEFSNFAAAAKACMDNVNCSAFDWKGIDIAENGSWKKLENPETTFYSTTDKNCQTFIGKDNVNMLRAPILFVGKGPPDPLSPPSSAIKGDVYVDSDTTNWYQWDNRGIFRPKGLIIAEKFKKVTISGKTEPSVPGSEGDFYVFIEPNNPQFFHVYHFENGRGWMQQQRVPGPGMFANAPEITNGSGFKIDEKTAWLLYAGIVGIVLGLIGTVWVFLKKDSPQNKCR